MSRPPLRINKSSWLPVFVAYGCFAACIVANDEYLRMLGAALVITTISVVALCSLYRLQCSLGDFARLTSIFVCLLASVVNNVATGIDIVATLKIAFIMTLYALGLFQPLCPITSSSTRHWFFALFCALVVLGIVSGLDDGARIEGSFSHVNILAFVTLVSLQFIHPVADRRYIAAFHSIALLLLLTLSSVGAVCAYVVALLLCNIRIIRSRRMAWRLLTSGGIAVAAIAAVLAIPEMQERATITYSRIEGQLFVLTDGFQDALQEGRYDNAKYRRMGLTPETSALWRITHWSQIVWDIRGARPERALFGFGPGASLKHYDIVPHSEGVRILYEYGLFGFLAVTWCVFAALARMQPEFRFPYVAALLYALQANPLDATFASGLTIFTASLLAGRAARQAETMGSGAPRPAPPLLLRHSGAGVR